MRTNDPNERRPCSPIAFSSVRQSRYPRKVIQVAGCLGIFCTHQLLPLAQLLKDASDDRTLKGDRVRPLHSVRLILAKLRSSG